MKKIYKFLLLICSPVSMWANDPFSKLPSEQTHTQIREMASTADRTQVRDWWLGGGTGEGPPTSGSGGGGAVGASLSSGTAPILIAGLVYLFFILGIRYKKHTATRKDKNKDKGKINPALKSPHKPTGIGV